MSTHHDYLLCCALSFQDGVGVSDELLALYRFLQLWKFRPQLLTKVLPLSSLQERNIKNIFKEILRIFPGIVQY